MIIVMITLLYCTVGVFEANVFCDDHCDDFVGQCNTNIEFSLDDDGVIGDDDLYQSQCLLFACKEL